MPVAAAGPGGRRRSLLATRRSGDLSCAPPWTDASGPAAPPVATEPEAASTQRAGADLLVRRRPTSSRWTAARRDRHAAVAVADGRILAVGPAVELGPRHPERRRARRAGRRGHARLRQRPPAPHRRPPGALLASPTTWPPAGDLRVGRARSTPPTAPDDDELSATLAAVESLRYGVTTVDGGRHRGPPGPGRRRPSKRVGIRGHGRARGAGTSATGRSRRRRPRSSPARPRCVDRPSRRAAWSRAG